MLNRIDILIKTRSRPYVVFMSLLITAVLGVIDYLSGREISFSIFYIFPIVMSTWYAGERAGLCVAVISSVVWAAADVLSGYEYSSTYVHIWNSLVRLFYFVLSVLLALEIRKRLDLEEMLADTDGLTGLKNRRAFFEQVDLERPRSARYNKTFTILYIDLDNFKCINDNYGHETGDELLIRVSTVIKANIRGMDTASRLGGDEFACLFPETDYADAESVIKKLLRVLRDEMKGMGWPVTFSLGAATFQRPAGTTSEIISYVDELMYRIKREGKDNYILVDKTGKIEPDSGT